MKFKKILSFIIITAMLMASLTACSTPDLKNDSDKLKIVVTIFPEYDWVNVVLGDKAKDAEVTMLLDNGVDLHSFQPTAADIANISTCDVFIYVGGESDSWVDDALSEAANKDMKVINLLDVLGDSVKEEEVVEGMEAEDEHDYDDSEEKGHDEDEAEYDEHVWLSLRNAQTLVREIANVLGEADPENKDIYTKNADAYIDKLSSLDDDYKIVVDNASTDTLLFGDRFPFRYLVDDYGLNYYAAFVGCSAETEASFETIVFLANKVDELNLKSVLIIENANDSIAKTIIDNTEEKNQQILTLNSMQGITSKDVDAGVTYISVMKDNLEVLNQALN
ncbi:MAG: zinc ABC transporter substrate-binding protein [Lachnospiraceae bacterium]|nr:zinc ABC transporter substrate-binding protein [Lachnospiraceae bacterium]